MPRTRRLHRGGGTASWTFAPAGLTQNNGMAWASSGCGGGSASHLPAGGGLPGMQKGGGGGTHYGFTGSGLAGGNVAYTSNCANQSGAAGQLNVPIPGSPLLAGGSRRNRRRNNRSRSNKNKSRSRSNRSRSRR